MAAAQRWTPVYVGLGSNLGEPVRQIIAAFTKLADMRDTRLIARSPLYRSAPVGPNDQPWYINAVAGLLTLRSPDQLLDDLLTLEREFGRVRGGQRWGPRTLDLDLLLYGHMTIEQPKLVIPHPELTNRNFVVYPLLRIAPELTLPDGRSLSVIGSELGSEGLEEISSAELTGDCTP
ncbi:MAG: 2-amino-4-hydroxy-6-hydroxymethyldihydropteridine diphosphokinase [Gammaproteobacteria bacterium]